MPQTLKCSGAASRRFVCLLAAACLALAVSPERLLAQPSSDADSSGAPAAVEIGGEELLQGEAIGRSIEWTRAEDPDASLVEMMRRGDWRAGDADLLGFGFTPSVYWARFRLRNSGETTRRIYLEQSYPLIDHITLHAIGEGGRPHTARKAGDRLPFSAREIEHRNPVFTLEVPPGERTYYLRYESASSLNIHLRLWSPEEFAASTSNEQLALGLYYGIILVMALYNFFLFLSLRDWSYLFYVFSIVGYGLYQFTLNGLSFQYLWPNAVWWGNASLPFFMFAGVSAAKLFSRSLLNTARYAPRLDRALLGLLLLTAALAPVSLFTPYRYGIIAAALLVLLSVILMAAAGWITLRAGYRPAQYYLLAWGMLLLGVLAFVLKSFGVLPSNFLTNWGQQIGSALEVILLSLALGARIRVLREEKDAAQKELIERQRESLETQARMNAAFERFVPQQFLGFLERESVAEVQLGDQVQKEMTILFADIRSFTERSERMDPAQNFAFLNEYLGRVGPIVRERGGFVDKYIGDAIMALFPASPDDAIRAAIQLQQAIREYNRTLLREGEDPIRVGAGLHTGNLILGTVGERERMDTTVISDAVNLAARIEALTKRVGASILISEESLFRLDNPSVYRFRMLGKVKVKGKSNHVSVFELFDGQADYALELMLATRRDFEAGVSAYYSREFVEAEGLFRKVLDANPADAAARLYADAAARGLRVAAPGED